MPANQNTSEAVILVKASPHVGKKHGETVCCAGVSDDGKWLRLYPVTFRTLDEAKQFKRWDRIRFRWEKPNDDPRPESTRVDHQSIEIIGELKRKDRLSFLNRIEVSSIKKVQAEGKTFALLRPRDLKFSIEKKEDKKFNAEKQDFKTFAAQTDLFTKPLMPFEPCPYEFKYKYTTEDGEREGTCQDWETDATFYNWSKQYGEKKALEEMQRVFGEDYPKKGMVFAMGTHSLYPDTWLINGIIRLDEITQLSLDL
ncbi:MAG: hypothetical protein EPO08_11410 [Rhodospirillaceae bacterium]|nr:MAG: hypothetical protein EPO08_11410 [Rhodospirillaceae bacterium]